MGRKKTPLKQLATIPLNHLELGDHLNPGRISEEEITWMVASLRDGEGPDPLLVMPGNKKNHYRIITGVRRFIAATRLNIKSLDCLVIGEGMAREIRVLERFQSNNYDPWELADTLTRMKTRLEWTQTHLGIAIGRSRDFIANILSIAQITSEARAYILDHAKGKELSARHLRYVARAREAEQLQVAKNILARRISTTILEREKKEQGHRPEQRELIRMRDLKKPGSGGSPRGVKAWKKYYRQLTTDMRRIEQQENQEMQNTRAVINNARQRQRAVRKEANRKRRELNRELRQAMKQLTRLGGL